MKNIIIVLVVLIGSSCWASSSEQVNRKKTLNRNVSCIEDCPCDLTAEEKEIVNLARVQLKTRVNTEVSEHMSKKMQDQFMETSEDELTTRKELGQLLGGLNTKQLKAVQNFIQKMPK